MSLIDVEDVFGYFINQKLLCPECYAEDGESATGVLVEAGMEEKVAFCGECGKLIE